ncbi:MAG: McrB family protein [Bacillota bacterium]
MNDEYCLIIRSNPGSSWDDTEGRSYHYGQTVPRYTRIRDGVRFIMDRRDAAGTVLVGYGAFGSVEDEGTDEQGRRLFRAHFKDFTPFPRPRVLPSELKNKIALQEGYNQQHSIRQITPQLFQELLAFGNAGASSDTLETFIKELRSLRLGVVSGEQKLYKPLMMLAAVRTLAEGGSLSFGDPLLTHYRAFAEAIQVDGTHPEYPYYYLGSEGFWKISDAEGQPLPAMDPPKRRILQGSSVRLEGERAKCVLNRLTRPSVIRALLEYFTPAQVAALGRVWHELEMGITTGKVEETIRSVHAYITAQGFVFTLEQIAAFYCALRTKPFVILAGISGTGKTRLPRLFAEAIGAEFRIEAVRPDWADSADLIGYRDLKERFRPGRLLVFAKQAAEAPFRPHFFVLDEMNLARVEHYLADVLSKIESRRRVDGKIITDTLVAAEETENGDHPASSSAWSEVSLPDNLFLVGTVNMDETTHSFSRKVLDRAFTLEFSDIDLSQRVPNQVTQPSRPEVTDISLLRPLGLTLGELYARGWGETCDRVISLLSSINGILQRAQLQVGYRVRDEACLFVCHAGEIPDILPETTALDYVLCAKILPRIQGGTVLLQDILLELLELCLETGKQGRAQVLRTLVEDIRRGDKSLRDLLEAKPLEQDAFIYPMAARKILIMLERLDRDGYTSYWL